MSNQMTAADCHWIEYVRAFGPVLIGLAVIWIAYQQWQVNRANLREKLFERRFEVFEESRDFLEAVVRNGGLDDYNLSAIWRAINLSRFLFDKELTEYLSELRTRAVRQQFIQKEISKLPLGDERSELTEDEVNQLNWLAAQKNVIYDKFQPYLGFNIKGS